jgi:5-hydroxyisourate hydrolase
VSGITTHVLDTSAGRPASGIAVVLERAEATNQWRRVGQGETEPDGRLRTLTPEGEHLIPGLYRLTFDTQRYFAGRGTACFFPSVAIVFDVQGGEHYHVPLLLSPFGYSTYRGS